MRPSWVKTLSSISAVAVQTPWCGPRLAEPVVAFPAQVPRSQGNFPGVTEASPGRGWLLLLRALLRRVSQEEVAQGALRGTWCSGTGLVRKETGTARVGRGRAGDGSAPNSPCLSCLNDKSCANFRSELKSAFSSFLYYKVEIEM